MSVCVCMHECAYACVCVCVCHASLTLYTVCAMLGVPQENEEGSWAQVRELLP